jgi:hypothetical protein
LGEVTERIDLDGKTRRLPLEHLRALANNQPDARRRLIVAAKALRSVKVCWGAPISGTLTVRVLSAVN